MNQTEKEIKSILDDMEEKLFEDDNEIDIYLDAIGLIKQEIGY